MNIYVGNLPYTTNESDLRNAFEIHGEVVSAKIVTDRESGRSKGFGFVEMPQDEEANTAINSLNGTELSGRTITVNEARPRQPGGGAGGGGGNRRGGGGRSEFRGGGNNRDRGGW
ncbi:RNA-binding protein [Myxococcota bacterium]|nr:RNA-binding protein [Myxococcota bacterium]